MMHGQPVRLCSVADVNLQHQLGVQEARRLIGQDKIIGATASNIEEAIKACKDGADYLGLGTVYSTATYVAVVVFLVFVLAHILPNRM